ncbi:quinone-dependent dihydroorotate dehydrogenase [Rhodococcus sp. X156]|uniref:quinone-dependent dihydroorotate dehydrogenase n=1 Tax=Rhodococcus sp. X156 TaxID=2499145 RepID=UPI000FD82F3F|nr:quinone-dependent dihydroorotate dehydrogenase [Rhodococcus sp. X156]
MYRLLFSLLLRRLDPEKAHTLAFGLLRLVTALPPLRWLLARVFTVRDPALRSTVLGIDFPAPLGLAAGFDKDATGVDAWEALGFGSVEVGTVTAHAQPGNPKPRMFRLVDDRAVVNRMGFNNHGAGAAADALRRRRTHLPVGVNIGKTKVVPAAEAADDYVQSARLLAPLADYLVVNVSSPNTPGLRDLQAVESLRPLLRAVQDTVSIPVLVKIAPDLSDADVDAIADLAVELGVAGIVATNTTVSRAGLRTPATTVEAIGAGGISGAPVAARSVEVLRRLHGRVGQELVLISVGGIETAEDAWERIAAGASLVQGYSGFVYGGPFYARRIHKGLARILRREGFTSIEQAVGSAARV